MPFFGGAVVSGNRKPTLHYLAKTPAVVHRLRNADPPCGSLFGPCGFCGEPSDSGIVLLFPPVGIIPPMLLSRLIFILRLPEGRAGECWKPSTVPLSYKLRTFSYLHRQPLPPHTAAQCHQALSCQSPACCDNHNTKL